MWRRAGVLMALLALAAGAAPKPRALVMRNGALTITLPAHLLRSKEVKQHLTSGLTTVFVLSATANDSNGWSRGGARIEVRFELWEEKYLVTLIDPTGQERKLTFAAEGELARWWSEQPVLVLPPRKFGERVDVEVKLKMLPFSSQEQNDTRRWLSRTLSGARAPSGEFTPAQSAEILRIIVETSIRRRPLLEYEWSLRAEREAAR